MTYAARLWPLLIALSACGGDGNECSAVGAPAEVQIVVPQPLATIEGAQLRVCAQGNCSTFVMHDGAEPNVKGNDILLQVRVEDAKLYADIYDVERLMPPEMATYTLELRDPANAIVASYTWVNPAFFESNDLGGKGCGYYYTTEPVLDDTNATPAN